MANKKVNKKNNINISVDDEKKDSIKKKILIASIVILCLVLFYLLAVYLINNDTSSVEKKDSDVDAVIDYDKILFGQSFKKNGEYYVVYYDGSDESLSTNITNIVSLYRSEEGTLSVYEVDMSSSFNKNYSTTEETNKNPSNIDELRINGVTLIKFKDKTVIEYIEGIDGIENTLKVEES